MIRPLRRLHRGMIVGLALVVGLLLILGLLARNPVPTVEELPAAAPRSGAEIRP